MEKDLAVGAIITRMMDLVAEHGFRKDTSRKYYCALRNFLGFATSHGFSLYSEDLLKQFKEDVQQRKLSDKYKMKLFRIAFLINGFVIAGEIDWNHHDPENHKHGITKYVSCPNFQKMIDESISYYQFHESKNKFYSLVTRKFCCELEKAGISDFSGLDHKVVDEMLLTFSPKYKGSMEKVIDNLRYFLRYLNQKNMCPLILLEPSVYKPVRRRKLIPCFTKDEVTRLLACCDRTTAAGMRDYAIVLLAVTSGLRACDIVSLELKDIDWRQYRINIIQETAHPARLVITTRITPHEYNIPSTEVRKVHIRVPDILDNGHLAIHGLEKTVEGYVTAINNVMVEVFRVLRKR